MATQRWTQRLSLKLPLDAVSDSGVRGNIRGAVFSRAAPTPLQTRPKLAVYSEDALRDLLDIAEPSEAVQSDELVDVFAGNACVPSAEPLAHRYGGHQFGVWAGQLGDGRAVLLGEYTNEKGERWEMQLKGAGKTPYSRFADGRAVIRSSVREFLCSEAMYYLGIPTSRALTLVVSDDLVARDQFYLGEPRLERAAVLLRAAPSWFRFGSLEMPHRDDDRLLLLTLIDHLCRFHFPETLEAGNDRFCALGAGVARSTARLAAAWQGVGFVHGVLNTDNMSVHGVTIDYGPFGFVERYSPNFVPNTSDTTGLYRLSRQPVVCRWNVGRLLETLEPFMSDEGLVSGHHALYVYDVEYLALSRRIAALKLGLMDASEPEPVLPTSEAEAPCRPSLQSPRFPPVQTTDTSSRDESAVTAAEARDETSMTDARDESAVTAAEVRDETSMTDARDESAVTAAETRDESSLTEARDESAITDPVTGRVMFDDPLSQLAATATSLVESRQTAEQLRTRLLHMMQQTGADYTATWRQLGELPLPELMEAAAADGARLGPRYWALQQLLAAPGLATWLRDYCRELELRDVSEEERRRRMCSVNPRYILRNWIAQEAIKATERDDFTILRHVHRVLQRPFTEQEDAEAAGYAGPPPDWARDLKVSCSS